MGREFELKYASDQDTLAAIARAYPGGKTITMETTYYDVPSRALGRLHWTLRRRLENGVSVCTLKTPCPDGGRGEWETECDGIEQAIPRLIALGAPAALADYTMEGLLPVCGARFTRQAIRVESGNAVVELALDRGVLLGGGKEAPLCEVEVELKEGTDPDAVSFAAALAEKYGLRPEKKSKFRRAKDLAESNINQNG